MAQNESIFLFEALVDKIVFVKSPCITDKDFKTCVNISFASMDPLEICEDDCSLDMPNTDPFIKYFNCGKSNLFSLPESDITQAMSKCLVKVIVEKTLPCGCLPTRVVMGETNIDMTKEFIQARKTFLSEPFSISSQSLKDFFRIISADGTEVGEILLFLRMSFFGKNIISKFHGEENKINLNLDDDSVIDRSCKPKKQFQTAADPCGCRSARELTGPSKLQRNISSKNIDKNVRNDLLPCEKNDDPCYCSGFKPQYYDPLSCTNIDRYCLHVPKGQSDEYEEIGTNLNGNELKIKVPKSSSVIKKISQTHCIMQRPYPKKAESGECAPPCGKNQINLALPCDATCCRGAQLQGTQFTCTTEGCTLASKHAQTSLTKNKPITLAPNIDCFVLKVAKTAMDGDRKCKLELELVTPKGKEKMPPTKKLNIRSQCEPECNCCQVCPPRTKKTKRKKSVK